MLFLFDDTHVSTIDHENPRLVSLKDKDTFELLDEKDHTLNEHFLPKLTKQDYLKFLHTLQRYRGIWGITANWPYLYIKARNLARLLKEKKKCWFVFLNGFVFQNISAKDLGETLLDLLLSGKTGDKLSPNGENFVQGMANPMSFDIFIPNNPLQVGTLAIFPTTTIIAGLEDDNVYQYSIGKLEIDQERNYTFPKSNHFNFSNIISLQNQYMNNYFYKKITLDKDAQIALSTLLDNIFKENEKLLENACKYHLKQKAQINTNGIS